MSSEKSKSAHAQIDEAVKTAFDAKAAEPVPENLIDLTRELDGPAKPSKTG